MSAYNYTLENEHFEPQKGGLAWKMFFFFNWVIFRFQPFIFRGVVDEMHIARFAVPVSFFLARKFQQGEESIIRKY